MQAIKNMAFKNRYATGLRYLSPRHTHSIENKRNFSTVVTNQTTQNIYKNIRISPKMFIMVSGLFADNQPGGRKMTKLLHCVKNKTLPPTSSYSPQTALTVCFVLALCFAPPCQHIDKVMGWDFIGSKKNLSYCLSQALK